MPDLLLDILIAISGPILIVGIATAFAFRNEIQAKIWDAWQFLTDRESFNQRYRGDRFERRELLKILLGLDDTALDQLFILYRERYGAGPARYAKRTYLKWKTGEVKPVRETFDRFAIEMPRVMSFALKCEVLRAFVNEFAVKETVEMDVSVSDWEEKLRPVVERLIERCYTTELPIEVERRLRWLGEGDMRTASELLKYSRAEETRLAVSMLREEFTAISELFGERGLKPVITHEIRLPGGTIALSVREK